METNEVWYQQNKKKVGINCYKGHRFGRKNEDYKYSEIFSHKREPVLPNIKIEGII